MKKCCYNCKNLSKRLIYPVIIATGEGECNILYKILYTTKRTVIRKEYLDHFYCNFYEKEDRK